jgi:hypothetical protein
MSLNQPLAAAADLYTTVRNLRTKATFFGFLPPHGRRLAAGEELSFIGSIQERLYTNGVLRNQKRKSLEAALDQDTGSPAKMAIVKTPAVILFDDTRDESKKLNLANGSFATADPSFAKYSQSLDDELFAGL